MPTPRTRVANFIRTVALLRLQARMFDVKRVTEIQLYRWFRRIRKEKINELYEIYSCMNYHCGNLAK